ncbi:MAG: polynucleotide adenylyltransferase PcnB [Pseudomonadales bacterium]|nr:polynucleotide adenylyltransferase PcnB [Pseudomonadales bacterium]NRA16826.1 polynucleotide adenylyltransferase PcnB [Oceanospirillaceae bacterium]
MPSFFKNIKKLFSKPAGRKAHQQADPVASKTAKRTVNRSPEQAPRQKSHMDPARAETINATIIPESEHQIIFRNIDNNAIKIVKDLQRASYESYLVGGCVRDLLLNKRPKDFDVTTGAHPEQAHKVFNRSRLIGRRFKLLHVRFGRELIEVATFRAAHDNSSEEQHARQADSGMILRDNVYGTIDQDALRRDFTINALYYDVNTRSIYDFTNGYQDIADRKIRMIGEPEERYREDPVRMLRAIRFAAKLDFSIEPQTAAPIKELAPMLYDIAPARLFDEVLKLLQSGHGNASMELLREYHLLQTLLPQTAQALELGVGNANELIFNALKNTDRRIKQRKSVSPGFLYAVLLWPVVQDQLNKVLANKRIPPITALHEVASNVISEQVKRTSIPKRFSTNIREIWELQFRLTRRPGNKAQQLVEHPRFRAAYDLLVLREKSGEDLEGMGSWWTEYQDASLEQREQLVNSLNAKKPSPKKRKTAAKSIPEKVVFEKFDVVEQVKAKPKSRPKKAPAGKSTDRVKTPEKANTATIDLPENGFTDSVTQSEDTSSAKPTEQVSKPVADPSDKPKIAVKPQATKAKVSVPEKSQPEPTKPETTKFEQPQPKVVEPAEHKPTVSVEEHSTDRATPKRKQRRSRAKNDPRNK